MTNYDTRYENGIGLGFDFFSSNGFWHIGFISFSIIVII